MHKRIFALESEWAKHLEGSYFSRATLKAATGMPVWYLDHGSQTLERSDHCNTLVVRWILEHYGVPLYGPATNTVVDPVRTEALRREMLGTLRSWGKDILAKPESYNNRFYQGFILLSYCRMLHDIETGRVGSKAGGAAWAKANLPEKWHALIDRSWQCRPDPYTSSRTPADPEDFAATLKFVKLAIDSTAG
jgi:hypothetical protein